jgi:hypothetical protein
MEGGKKMHRGVKKPVEPPVYGAAREAAVRDYREAAIRELRKREGAAIKSRISKLAADNERLRSDDRREDSRLSKLAAIDEKNERLRPDEGRTHSRLGELAAIEEKNESLRSEKSELVAPEEKLLNELSLAPETVEIPAAIERKWSRTAPKDAPPVPAFKMFHRNEIYDKTPGGSPARNKAAAERRWREGRDAGEAAKARVPKKKSAYMLFCDDKRSALGRWELRGSAGSECARSRRDWQGGHGQGGGSM